MKTKKLINDLKNNGGCTLGLKAKNGFMVSLMGYERKIKLEENEIKKTLEEYQKIRKELIKKENFKNVYIGMWLENGYIYFDISTLIKDYSKALELGKNNKQLAIYNIEENKTIYL